MKKRVLMLTSTWDSKFSQSIISGVLERIGDDDIELHIFNDYDYRIETKFYEKGREIYSLPSPEHYDGLILALSTVESVKYIRSVAEKFHKHNKPIVSVDTRVENAIFCGLDNYRSMYQLVEHMVTIHDCRVFNYLGGPEDNEENAERYRAFCDCLKSHGIGIEKNRVRHMGFLKWNGNEAYKEWKKSGLNIADAVICANDFMALGYVEEAERDGVETPNLIKVTGFDNISDAQSNTPSITSVNRNRKQLGYDAMDALLEALEEKPEFDTRFIEGYICFNESCGCDTNRDIRADYNKLFEKNKKSREVLIGQGYARMVLDDCQSFDDCGKALKKCEELLKISDIAICINKSIADGEDNGNGSGYEDERVMITGEYTETTDKRDVLFPEKMAKGNKTFLFVSLRSNDRTFGYMAMPYDSGFFTRFRLGIFAELLSIAMENVWMKARIDKLKER